MNIFKPFQNLKSYSTNLIVATWLFLMLAVWGYYSLQTTHFFPSLQQVGKGFSDLWGQGLITHVFSSLWLCARAVVIAVFVSLTLVYLSPIPVIRPIAVFISKFRYLPLTGIAFYITMLVKDGRTIQIWILVTFMVTYLVTSLLSMLKDIEEREFDHARALGCNRWQILWEVVIKGRMDYVIEIIRQNLAIVWMFLVTVESILAASGGLGFLIKNSDKFMSHGRIIALQIVILAVGLFLDYFINTVRKLLFRYSKI